jgi:hypothetical protein
LSWLPDWLKIIAFKTNGSFGKMGKKIKINKRSNHDVRFELYKEARVLKLELRVG